MRAHAPAQRKKRSPRRPDRSRRHRFVPASGGDAQKPSRGNRRNVAAVAAMSKVITMRVGFVGWRGMVGSVLMSRMQEERDFERVEPLFFSTSAVGGKGPSIGGKAASLRDAADAKAFAGLDAIVTCQGGDWTNAMHAKIRAAGFAGYWIDAASALRMSDDAV